MKTDFEIQHDIQEEFVWDPAVNSAEIGVSVKNGIVTLSGLVDSYFEKLAAEKAAGKIAGVKAVALEIEVKSGKAGTPGDSELAEKVLNVLKWNSALEDDRISVKVEDGRVTLEGSVDWDFQRDSASSAIESLLGVRGITNRLKIVPVVDLADVKHHIKAAFHRAATIDSGKINIESDGSKVILSGRVRSYAEKTEAEKAAWFTPGVTSVDNLLEIDSAVFSY